MGRTATCCKSFSEIVAGIGEHVPVQTRVLA
jgi:hypothetical protein